jgi:antitoxin HicB
VANKRKGKIGSSFEGFLRDEGILEETTAAAIKSVLAWQLTNAMRKQGLTKNELAARMRTSRSQLDRVLDPENDRVQLDTVIKAARALGRELRMELV